LKEIAAHYESGAERIRLASWARFEFLRNIELLHRYLPEPPATIGDVGGGPGTYALPLAATGHIVHLIDPIGLHLEQALEASSSGNSPGLASTAIGDARELPWTSESMDAVLLFGPLYHLTSSTERLTALEEAKRVLRPGGLLFAMAISRFSSIKDGLDKGFLADPKFRSIVDREIESGQHRNPDRHPQWFTTAYFHRPDELECEIANAGFDTRALLAVEGPAGRLRNLNWWLDQDDRREVLMATVRRVESERSLLGASPQLLAVACKPARRAR
jgi:ubiquinone/menaquinone biosynthesis C-methylase UbiE